MTFKTRDVRYRKPIWRGGLEWEANGSIGASAGFDPSLQRVAFQVEEHRGFGLDVVDQLPGR